MKWRKQANPHYYSAFIHRCKKARYFFLKFLIILLLMSPHSHVNSQVAQESTTLLHKGSKLVSDPEFTKSSLSPKHFESKPPSRVQENHHLRLQFLFLLTPVRLKDSSTIPTIPKATRKSNCNLWTKTSRTKEHSTHRSMKANTAINPAVVNRSRINQIIIHLQFYPLNNVYMPHACVSHSYSY